jgi:hypothetical protein
MITNASHIASAMRRQRHHHLLFAFRVMARSRRDLVVVQGGACGEHEAVRRLVDQPGSDEPCDRFDGVLRGRTGVRAVADKLVHRPRALIVRVDQPDHHAPVVTVVRLDHWVRLLLHRKVPPFGATAPGQFALSLGPISRMQPTLDAPGNALNQFCYSFRRSLLGSVPWRHALDCAANIYAYALAVKRIDVRVSA